MTNKEMATVILETACEVMQVDMEQVKSKCRKRELSDTRKMYCLAARKLIADEWGGPRITFRETGELIGRDHSTALTAKKRAEELFETDVTFCGRLNLFMDITQGRLKNGNDIEIARWAQTMGTI